MNFLFRTRGTNSHFQYVLKGKVSKEILFAKLKGKEMVDLSQKVQTLKPPSCPRGLRQSHRL